MPDSKVRIATEAKSLAELEASIAGCRGCPLWARATQAVCGEGSPQARIMLVGEQPGDQEDLAGKPFVGPAGRVLDEALLIAGIERRTSTSPTRSSTSAGNRGASAVCTRRPRSRKSRRASIGCSAKFD